MECLCGGQSPEGAVKLFKDVQGQQAEVRYQPAVSSIHGETEGRGAVKLWISWNFG